VFAIVTEGFEMVELFNPDVGNHEYEYPLVEVAPIIPDCPLQKETGLPVFATGIGLTDTCVWLMPVHPLGLVTVTLYIVVIVGVTTGLEIVENAILPGESHEYKYPIPEGLTDNVAFDPIQIV
jgi:hypothetical protein